MSNAAFFANSKDNSQFCHILAGMTQKQSMSKFIPSMSIILGKVEPQIQRLPASQLRTACIPSMIHMHVANHCTSFYSKTKI